MASAEVDFGGLSYANVEGFGGGSGGVGGGAGLGECVRETEGKERPKGSLKNARAFFRKPDIAADQVGETVRE